MRQKPGNYPLTIYHGQGVVLDPISVRNPAGLLTALTGTVRAGLAPVSDEESIKYPLAVTKSPNQDSVVASLSKALLASIPPGRYLFSLVLEGVFEAPVILIRDYWTIKGGSNV